MRCCIDVALPPLDCRQPVPQHPSRWRSRHYQVRLGQFSLFRGFAGVVRFCVVWRFYQPLFLFYFAHDLFFFSCSVYLGGREDHAGLHMSSRIYRIRTPTAFQLAELPHQLHRFRWSSVFAWCAGFWSLVSRSASQLPNPLLFEDGSDVEKQQEYLLLVEQHHLQIRRLRKWYRP